MKVETVGIICLCFMLSNSECNKILNPKININPSARLGL